MLVDVLKFKFEMIVDLRTGIVHNRNSFGKFFSRGPKTPAFAVKEGNAPSISNSPSFVLPFPVQGRSYRPLCSLPSGED
jgi:hypothetical protein